LAPQDSFRSTGRGRGGLGPKEGLRRRGWGLSGRLWGGDAGDAAAADVGPADRVLGSWCFVRARWGRWCGAGSDTDQGWSRWVALSTEHRVNCAVHAGVTVVCRVVRTVRIFAWRGE